MGGCWERLVRSIKRVLEITLRDRVLTDETLSTFLVEVESILNKRPLTHVSIDPMDPRPLTPNEILKLYPDTVDSPSSFAISDDNMTLRKQWRYAQKLADIFWSRWVKEYLPSLTTRAKWRSSQNSYQVGDTGLIADGTEPRNFWPVGKIIKVFPGKDGRVRVADVETKNGVFRRSVHKLALLPVEPVEDDKK